jgi:1,4-dihydroxy-6-naphthoate synthase
MDLGEFWESNTALPIPLGGIAIKRNFPLSICEKVDRVLKRSVLFAMEHPEQTIDFVSRHAREMDREVMFSHIDLYVNNYTVELGSKGNKAVRHLFDQCIKQGIIQADYQELLLS